MMNKIHNNPDPIEPRAPLIFHKEMEDKWLNFIVEVLDKKAIVELIQEYPFQNYRNPFLI